LAGRAGQRLAQQPGTQVGIADALAWPAPQPGPGEAGVQLLDRERRIGIAPVTQPQRYHALGVSRESSGVAGPVAQGELLAVMAGHPHRGRQVAAERVVQADHAVFHQVGQEQPGEHLGDGADLQDRAAVGEDLGAGADAAIPDQALLAARQAPDHQTDAPAGPHGPPGQKVHRVQPDHLVWSSGCWHACSISG
jgi:hypothetical protein